MRSINSSRSFYDVKSTSRALQSSCAASPADSVMGIGDLHSEMAGRSPIALRPGRSAVELTLRVYYHLLPGADDVLAETIEGLYG